METNTKQGNFFLFRWVRALRNRFLVDPRICQNCECYNRNEPTQIYPGYVNPHYPKVYCLKRHKWMAWDARRLCFQGDARANLKPQKGTCAMCGAFIARRDKICEECEWSTDIEDIANCMCAEDTTKRLLLLKELREHPQSKLGQALFPIKREYPWDEGTRDPIFLLLRERMGCAQTTRDYYDGNYILKEGKILESPIQLKEKTLGRIFVDEEGYFCVQETAEENRHLTYQEIKDADFPDVYFYDTCEGVFFTREEGEQYLLNNKHHFPQGEGRIYCIPASGRLREILDRLTTYNKPKDGAK